MSLRTRLLSCCVTGAVAAALLAAVPGSTAVAVDPACPWTSSDGAVYTWVGGQAGSDDVWDWPGNDLTTSNWSSPAGRSNRPNDDQNHNDANEPGEVGDTSDTYVCIPAGSTVKITNQFNRFPFVQGIWVAPTATVNITRGAGLFVQSAQSPSTLVTSSFMQGSSLNMSAGSLGGRGTLVLDGLSEIRSSLNHGGASTLGTKKLNDETAPHLGHLIVGPNGTMTLPERGVGLRFGLDLRIEGTLRLERSLSSDAPGDGFLGAAWGTKTEIAAGGLFDIADDGGYYQGSQPPGVTELGDLINNGTLLKSGGVGTSVVDADYGGAGEVRVEAGTLALPDGTSPSGGGSTQARTADLGSGVSFATGRCAGPVDPITGSCPPVINAANPASVSYTSSSLGPSDAVVLKEGDPGGVVFDGVSHDVITVGAASSAATPAHPTRLIFTYASSATGGQPLAGLQMLEAPTSTDVWRVLPPCLQIGTVQPGVDTCVDLGASSTGGDGTVVVVVETIAEASSRHIISRVGAPVSGSATSVPSPRVGATLDARAVSFTPSPPDPAPSAFEYSWSADGVALSGTGPSGSQLPLTPDLAGRTIILVVLASHPSWGTGLFTFPLGAVALGDLKSAQPHLVKHGKKFEVVEGAWAEVAQFTYAWFHRGKRLASHSRTLKLKKQWRGDRIYVEVTGSANGYRPVTERSPGKKVPR